MSSEGFYDPFLGLFSRGSPPKKLAFFQIAQNRLKGTLFHCNYIIYFVNVNNFFKKFSLDFWIDLWYNRNGKQFAILQEILQKSMGLAFSCKMWYNIYNKRVTNRLRKENLEKQRLQNVIFHNSKSEQMCGRREAELAGAYFSALAC